jgi:hypothetical protein
MRKFYSLLVLLPLFIVASATMAWGQYPAKCDGDKSCIGNALTIDVSGGKVAQYVDVDTSSVLRALSDELSFEAWISPDVQPGKRIFIAGLWGPNRDNNDQWVVYIENETITFALSADGSYLGDVDNTIVTVAVPGLYTRGWTHIAAVWDGASTAARVYIDGFARARVSNAAYPLRRLKAVESRKLPMQIGSCNSLYDDTTRYRSLKGQIDEVRLWSRALTDQDIRCGYIRSFNGNETGLVLYYRCNEAINAQTLCDATGNNLVGQMRSGAHCEKSNRTLPVPYSISPGPIDQTLYCTSDTTMTFTVTDSSFCGNNVNFRMVGADAGLFTVSPASATLQQGVPQTVTVRLRATLIGTINARFRVSNTDRCGAQVEVPIKFQRRTELDYSKGRLATDTLYVGCIEKTFSEDTLRICNNTGRPMSIDSLRLVFGTVFTWRPLDPARAAPTTLASGTCWSVIVRMNVGDTSKTENDTLKIYSDDRCSGSGVIPIAGRTQEVLVLLDNSGFKRVDSMDFGAVCPGQISDVRLYQPRNLVGERITIDTIEIAPKAFYGRREIFPIPLLPATAYIATYFRFRPDRAGPFTGSARFITRYRGCTIVKTIYLKGRGISVDVAFATALVGFGNVTIGKVGVQAVPVTNRGAEARRMSAYLKQGDVFRITGNGTFNIVPGQTLNITLEFRPRERVTYYDTLCIFDEQCYQTICVPVSGTGVFESLSFSPTYVSMDNVVGCQCRIDTLTVTNISGSGQVVTQARLNDLTGKFRLLGSVPSGAMASNQSFTYIVEYCPNDLVDDRADQAFIDLLLSNGETYQVLIRANSVVPKLFVTPLTVYGRVEVGWRQREMILVENASSVPIHVTTANVPPGFTVISTNPVLPTTLAPRDSLWLEVELAPTVEQTYSGDITLSSDDPCPLSWKGKVSGKAEIIRLEVPISFINYGLIRPCDCAVREIPLPNGSAFIPMTVDSVWIDGVGVGNPRPQVFTWRSRQTGNSTLPYVIQPGTVDTLLISFCPNIPATQQNILSNAAIHIKASTRDWNQTYTTTLSGRRELNFQPNTTLVQFPATRVDTTARPIRVTITVPDAFQNPSGDSIIITGITFVPDQRVFSVNEAGNAPFPWVIRRGDTLRFFVNFYPRAPKDYVARLYMHTSFPCAGVDTTILVKGSGFAPAFGMQMAFDTARVGLDTFHLTTCDTLVIPVMISRDIPQRVIDIAFRIGYDSTILRLLDISSPYTATATVADTGDGARAYLKNARDALAGTVAWVRFVVRGGASQFPIFLDEIDFDSDSLVFFKIVAGVDQAWVIVDEPLIAVQKVTDFDTVNLKSCADRIVKVWNPGAVPIRFDSLGGLPIGHRVTASNRPFPTTLDPGDSILLTITFCPWVEASYSSTIFSQSNDPCPIRDTGLIASVGFAPPFPMRFLLSQDPNETVLISGAIADTVELPLFIDRDCPQTPLDLNMLLTYNRRSLQFLGVSSAYSSRATGTQVAGGVRINIPRCDSLKKGEVARLRFVIAVPDSINTAIYLVPEKFTSDSVFWVKLDPPITTGDTGAVRVDPKCNISRLTFRGGANKLAVPIPNPTRGRATIEAEFVEDSRARLSIFNSAGVEVMQLLDGEELLSGGRYRFEFDLRSLPSGDYFCVLEAGRYRDSQRLQVVK